MSNKFLDETGLSTFRDWIKSKLSGKQDTLISGENIKTIGGESVLGSGNIDVGGDAFYATKDVTTAQELIAAFNAGKIIMLRQTKIDNTYPFVVVQFAVHNASHCSLVVYNVNGMTLSNGVMVLKYVVVNSTWSVEMQSMQNRLESGINIKTINNTSLLGSGNINIEGGGDDNVFEIVYEETTYEECLDAIQKNMRLMFRYTKPTGELPILTYVTYAEHVDYGNDLFGIKFGTVEIISGPRPFAKGTSYEVLSDGRWRRSVKGLQDYLISGENIKTINNQNILGSGNISIGGVFVAKVNKTTSEELIAAYEENKLIIIIPSGSAHTLWKYIVARFEKTTNGSCEMVAVTTDGAGNNAHGKMTRMYFSVEGSTWTLSSINVQDELVSGANIKTINGYSLVGSGNIDITVDSAVFIAEYGVTSYADVRNAIDNNQVIVVNQGTGSVICNTTINNDGKSNESITLYCAARMTSSTNVLNVIYNISKSLDTWNVFNSQLYIDNKILDTTTSPVQGNVIKNYVDVANAILQAQLGTLTDLTTDNKDNLVNAINEVYEKSGEPFRVKNWASNTLNVEIPTCTEDIGNTSIPKMVFSIDNVEGADYQIVGMLAYEVFDAASGGNRINCWPVCQFTGNGQKELSVRWMCGGTMRKTAKRMNAWVLLKHR